MRVILRPCVSPPPSQPCCSTPGGTVVRRSCAYKHSVKHRHPSVARVVVLSPSVATSGACARIVQLWPWQFRPRAHQGPDVVGGWLPPLRSGPRPGPGLGLALVQGLGLAPLHGRNLERLVTGKANIQWEQPIRRPLRRGVIRLRSMSSILYPASSVLAFCILLIRVFSSCILVFRTPLCLHVRCYI